jgi:hypothetical protein
MQCISCGNPKEKEEKYIVPDPKTAPTVTDPAMLREAAAGSNRPCKFCGSDERTLNNACRNCGANFNEEGHQYHEARAPFEFHSPRASNDYDGSLHRESAPRAWYHNEHTLLFVIGGGLAGLLFIGFMLWLFLPSEKEVIVQALYWKHTITLEQRNTLHAEDWRSDMDSTAFNTRCENRLKTHENCHPHNCNPHSVDHQCNPHNCECEENCPENENGYAECTTTCNTCYDNCPEIEYDTCYDQCPVYEDWCSYDYYKWIPIKTEYRDGTDHNESWPNLTAQGETERLRNATEYLVTFTREQAEWKYSPKTLEEFRRYYLGDPWTIKVNHAGQVWPVEKLTAESAK